MEMGSTVLEIVRIDRWTDGGTGMAKLMDTAFSKVQTIKKRNK
jgi:hypothetical protein